MLQIYDSPEALKKFEPHYRQVRYGLATKIEKASRQQRTFCPEEVPHAHALINVKQASSARIVRRSCGVLRRSRAQRRRRETKRLHDTHIWCCEVGEERDGRLSCSILARFIIADDTAYGQGNGVRLRPSIRMVAKMKSH